MDESLRKQYDAQIERQRVRDNLELGVDDSDPFQKVFEVFTDIEKGVFVLLEYGFTPQWIYHHLEFSRQRYSQIVISIRQKIMEEKENEETL